MTGVDRRAMLGMSAALTGASVLAGKDVLASTAVGSSAAPTSGAVILPARSIEPPTSISEAARDYLRTGAKRPYVAPPPAADAAAWEASIAAQEAGALKMMKGGDLVFPGFKVEDRIIGGVIVYVVTPPAAAPNQGKPHMNIHGGGWTSLGGKIARVFAQVAAQALGGIVYGVDYRRPPEHPFPAPLDDCLAVYRELLKLHAPETILVAGSSAGSNLAAAMMHKARNTGLPKPSCLFLDTPIVDLRCTGDSLVTNQYLDTELKMWSPRDNVGIYAHGADLANPYLSPLLGNLEAGFPPTYLRTGTRDLFLSDTVRFHAALRKAGVEADLYVGEAMPHGGFGSRTPEDEDARRDLLRWLAGHWRSAR